MWLDPNPPYAIKLMGAVSYGPGKSVVGAHKKDLSPSINILNLLVVCGLSGIYASMSFVVDWINGVTRNCNSKTCSWNQCMTYDKLLPQAKRVLRGELGRTGPYKENRPFPGLAHL